MPEDEKYWDPYQHDFQPGSGSLVCLLCGCLVNVLKGKRHRERCHD